MKRSLRIVQDWSEWYTRDLAGSVGADRREELASDLHEHAADGGSNVAIISRWLRGVPSDLIWRFAQLRGARSAGLILPRPAIFVFAVWLAVGMVGVSAFATARWAAFTYGSFGDVTTVWEFAAVSAVGLIGLALFVRRRTRQVGAFVLAVSAFLLNWNVYLALSAISFTIGSLYVRLFAGLNRHGIPLLVEMVVALAPFLISSSVFFIAAARSGRQSKMPLIAHD
jgi:hypothetical protein